MQMDYAHGVGSIPGVLDVYRDPQLLPLARLQVWCRQKEPSQRVGLRKAMAGLGQGLRLLQASQYVQFGSHRLLLRRVQTIHTPLRAALGMRGFYQPSGNPVLRSRSNP
jgi:hypothetical protein